jgi:DNA primase catalytic subunit
MVDPVDQTAPRERATRVDEKVERAKQMIQTAEKLKKVKDVWNEMLEVIQHDRSRHGRAQKAQIRLSLDALYQITPMVAQNADSIAPIRNIQYACSRQARKEKQEAKMLRDISNSLGRGLGEPKTSSAFQNLEKAVHGDQKLNPIRKPCSNKRYGNSFILKKQSTAEKNRISFPALPTPKNIGIYSPSEAHSILKWKEKSVFVQFRKCY